MHRIQVTRDEGLIYLGKFRLEVLENQNGNYNLLQNRGANINQFIDIKLVKSTGQLIVFEEASSDLVRYTPTLAEHQRLDGRRALDLEGAEIVTTLYNGDHITYIWMLGDNSVGLVDTNSFEFDIIENFFGPNNIAVTPFTVIASNMKRKLLGLYIQNNELFFAFMRGTGPIVRKSQTEVLGDSKIIINRRNCSLYGNLHR